MSLVLVRKSIYVIFVLVFAAFTLIKPASLHAQSTQISGRVVDQSSSVLPQTTLRLKSVETGEERSASSNDEGYFSFPSLQPGHYEVSASHDGFTPQIQSGIVVETGVNTTANFKLQVGEVRQAVTVEAGYQALQTESAAVSRVVENQTIVNMPLLDRRAAQLQRLSGFTVGNGSGSNATFAVAGGRSNNGAYMIDGGNVQNALLGTATLYFDPPVESLQEFNMALSNYAAELGRTGGAVVQMATKSGTNRFHGSAYEYLRNDLLQGTPYFATRKAPLRYNLFGVSFSGPIVRNKTHFFFNYEGFRQTAATTQVLNVPTPAEVSGDFSADSYKVINPATGTQFPGNIILLPQQDPNGAALAKFYPKPNVAGAASGKANFTANVPSKTVTDTYVARVDHVFSDKDRIFGRFLGDPSHITTGSVYPTPGTDSFGNSNPTYYYNASATWYHTFSGNLLNLFRATYSQRENVNISAGVGTPYTAQIGLQGTNLGFFPGVTVAGFQSIGNTSQQQRLQKPFIDAELADNVSWQHGKHQFKAGFSRRYNINVDRYSPSAGGIFNFTTKVTGSSLANLLLGRVDSASRQENQPLHTRADSYGLYFQDDWRLTPRLTLNLGVRYDIDTPRWETHNRQNSFDPNAINPVSGTPGLITFSGRNGLSKYANNTDKNNIGPRFGFAFQADQHTVFRGGAAVLYTGEYDEATPLDASAGFSLQGSFSSPDNGVTPAFYLRNGLPAITLPTEANLNAGFGAVKPGQSPRTQVDYFKPIRSTGYLYQTSLDVQHQFPGLVVVDIAYLGTFGHHLPSPTHININQVPTALLGPGNLQSKRPFPQFNNVVLDSADIGNSNYEGLNFGIEKHASHGIQFGANYTFSKFLDDLAARNELAAYPGTNAFTDYYNPRSRRGRSGNDVRHRLVVSTVYELPVGRGRLWTPSSPVLRNVLGGWSAGAIVETHTGTPLSPIELTNNTGSFSDGVRPNVVGNPNLNSARPRAQKLAKWFNTAAFASPAPYTFGNAGRTFGSGPSLFTADASLLKTFDTFEGTKLQFRAEALNVFNHANCANPDMRNGSATFGQVTALAAGTQSRVLQLALHLEF